MGPGFRNAKGRGHALICESQRGMGLGGERMSLNIKVPRLEFYVWPKSLE
jgi:hypothetical protein